MDKQKEEELRGVMRGVMMREITEERALADRLAEQLDQAQWVWGYYESSMTGCYKCPECEAEANDFCVGKGRAKHDDGCSLAAALTEHEERRRGCPAVEVESLGTSHSSELSRETLADLLEQLVSKEKAREAVQKGLETERGIMHEVVRTVEEERDRARARCRELKRGHRAAHDALATEQRKNDELRAKLVRGGIGDMNDETKTPLARLIMAARAAVTALDILTTDRPILASRMVGTTTLGNVRAELLGASREVDKELLGKRGSGEVLQDWMDTSLGIRARFVVEEERSREILAGMLRFLDAGKKIPLSWKEELLTMCTIWEKEDDEWL